MSVPLIELYFQLFQMSLLGSKDFDWLDLQGVTQWFEPGKPLAQFRSRLCLHELEQRKAVWGNVTNVICSSWALTQIRFVSHNLIFVRGQVNVSLFSFVILRHIFLRKLHTRIKCQFISQVFNTTEFFITRSELEWTIIFGLNFTKIYGGHMSSTDFCGGHVSTMTVPDTKKSVPDTKNLFQTQKI